MRIAIEEPQLTEVSFHQILDTKSQNTIVNIINLFHETLGGGEGIPWHPYLFASISMNFEMNNLFIFNLFILTVS